MDLEGGIVKRRDTGRTEGDTMRTAAIFLVLLILGAPSFGQTSSYDRYQMARAYRSRYAQQVAARTAQPSRADAQAAARAKAQQAIWHAQPTAQRRSPSDAPTTRARIPRSRTSRVRLVQHEELPEGNVVMEPAPYQDGGTGGAEILPGEFSSGEMAPYEMGPYDVGPYDVGPYEVGPFDEGPFHEGPYVEGPYGPGEYEIGPGCACDGCLGCDACLGCDPCCGGCGDPCCDGCGECGVRRFRPPSGDLQFELGVQGFTGPPNLGASSSFGFQQSVNFGMRLPIFRGRIGWQIGVRTLQSNLDGAQFSTDRRNQTFFTTGLFRRACARGWQWGLVVDLVNDDWYEETTIRQVRGEIGWRLSACQDWGYWFNFGGDEDTTLQPDILTPRPPGTTLDHWEPLDLHAIYYRSQIGRISGSQFRCFLGFSGESDGLLGIDTNLPIGGRWGIRSNFTYLVPDQSAGEGGYENEAWNLGIALTWNLRGPTRPGRFAPLFNVADNGTFIVDRVSAN